MIWLVTEARKIIEVKMVNKQEAIEKLESRAFDIEDTDLVVGLSFAKHTINQIDEPKKPVVPQFVADYIDSEQYSCSTLSEALDNMDDEKRILDWFYINPETFAKAWLYGYEIEKEKLYTARFKATNEYLYFDEDYKELICFAAPKQIAESCRKYHFTKEKLIGYHVWDNPAFEVEEVKDD